MIEYLDPPFQELFLMNLCKIFWADKCHIYAKPSTLSFHKLTNANVFFSNQVQSAEGSPATTVPYTTIRPPAKSRTPLPPLGIMEDNLWWEFKIVVFNNINWNILHSSNNAVKFLQVTNILT